jgi:hypothetical protein
MADPELEDSPTNQRLRRSKLLNLNSANLLKAA